MKNFGFFLALSFAVAVTMTSCKDANEVAPQVSKTDSTALAKSLLSKNGKFAELQANATADASSSTNYFADWEVTNNAKDGTKVLMAWFGIPGTLGDTTRTIAPAKSSDFLFFVGGANLSHITQASAVELMNKNGIRKLAYTRWLDDKQSVVYIWTFFTEPAPKRSYVTIQVIRSEVNKSQNGKDLEVTNLEASMSFWWNGGGSTGTGSGTGTGTGGGTVVTVGQFLNFATGKVYTDETFAVDANRASTTDGGKEATEEWLYAQKAFIYKLAPFFKLNPGKGLEGGYYNNSGSDFNFTQDATKLANNNSAEDFLGYKELKRLGGLDIVASMPASAADWTPITAGTYAGGFEKTKDGFTVRVYHTKSKVTYFAGTAEKPASVGVVSGLDVHIIYGGKDIVNYFIYSTKGYSN